MGTAAPGWSRPLWNTDSVVHLSDLKLAPSQRILTAEWHEGLSEGHVLHSLLGDHTAVVVTPDDVGEGADVETLMCL